LARSGVQVATVKPGFVCTRVTGRIDLPCGLYGLPGEREDIAAAVIQIIPDDIL